MENNTDKNTDIKLKDNLKIKRIGTFTFGLTLIAIGLGSIFFLFVGIDSFRYAMALWPLFLVSLGVETLYYSKSENIIIKYDVWNIILTTCLIGFTLCLAFGNLLINEIFFKNNELKRYIEERVRYNIEEKIYDNIEEKIYDNIEEKIYDNIK